MSLKTPSTHTGPYSASHKTPMLFVSLHHRSLKPQRCPLEKERATSTTNGLTHEVPPTRATNETNRFHGWTKPPTFDIYIYMYIHNVITYITLYNISPVTQNKRDVTQYKQNIAFQISLYSHVLNKQSFCLFGFGHTHALPPNKSCNH